MCELQGNVQTTLRTICLTGAQILTPDASLSLSQKAVNRTCCHELFGLCIGPVIMPVLKAPNLPLLICVLAKQRSPREEEELQTIPALPGAAGQGWRRRCLSVWTAATCFTRLKPKEFQPPVLAPCHYLSQTSPLKEETQKECLFISGRFISLASAEIICLGTQTLQRSD